MMNKRNIKQYVLYPDVSYGHSKIALYENGVKTFTYDDVFILDDEIVEKIEKDGYIRAFTNHQISILEEQLKTMQQNLNNMKKNILIKEN